MYCVYLIIYSGDKLPKCYIGSTELEKLKNGYRGSVVSKKYKDIFISEIKNNYDKFTYVILESCYERKEALFYELFYHKLFNVVKSSFFYNESYASINGMFGRDVKGILNPMYGKKHSIVSKSIMSEKRGIEKRYVMTDNHKKILSDTHKGKTLSDETKNKISDKIKDTVVIKDKDENVFRVSVYDEKYLNGEYDTLNKGMHTVKDKDGNVFSISNKDERYLSGELVSINKGREVTEETRKKLSVANKGKIISEETKNKISYSKKGKKRAEFSKEWKDNISKSLKGRVFSQDSKDKLIKSKTGMKYKISTCPHCGKTGGGGNMKRYHFEKCKLKK